MRDDLGLVIVMRMDERNEIGEERNICSVNVEKLLLKVKSESQNIFNDSIIIIVFLKKKTTGTCVYMYM